MVEKGALEFRSGGQGLGPGSENLGRGRIILVQIKTGPLEVDPPQGLGGPGQPGHVLGHPQVLGGFPSLPCLAATVARLAWLMLALLQQSLGVSRAMATRIVADASGEPFAVAGRALAMPSGVFQRILMFLNPEIGQSVQRVYDLADLFLELPQDSALHLVRVWRLADRSEARATLHRAVHRTESRKNPQTASPQERQRGTDSQAATGATQRRA